MAVLFAFVSLACMAQTTTTYYASTGSVTSVNAVTGLFDNGGSFQSPDSMGGGCYYGGCPAWQFANYRLSYILPDGTTATLTNFTGTADFLLQSDVKVQGTASGTDSLGRSVSVTISFDWAARCRSGRGGGCTKKFLDGSMTMKNN